MPTFEHIFEVMLKGNTPDGVVRNVFQYTTLEPILNGNDAAKALGDEFASAAVLTPIAAVTSAHCTFVQVRVTDLADTDTLYDLSISVAGGQPGDEASPFEAISFHSAQPAVGTHRASKRFGPLSSASIAADGILAGGLGTDLANLQDMLNAQVHTDDDGLFVADWSLMLVKRIKHAGPPVTYTMPGPADFPAVAYYTTGWDWNVHVGTQNTRKFGRGE